MSGLQIDFAIGLPREGSHEVQGVAPLEGITHPLTGPATAPISNGDSVDSSNDTIMQLTTIMVSKFPSNVPELLYLTLIGQIFAELKYDQNRIKLQVEEIYRNISYNKQNLSAKALVDLQGSPTWSNIAGSPSSTTAKRPPQLPAP